MLTIEKIKEVIEKIAPEYNLKKVTLFGSRATGKNREDSDVDLIVDFPDGTTLITHSSLKIDLEDELGLPVDVISRGGLEGSILEIEKEIELYAT